MRAVAPLVDVELAASRWLRADPDVVAIVGSRVYTELPAAKEWPMLRVFRVGGAPDSWPMHVDRADLQLDAFGGSKREANDLLRASMTALYRLTLPGAWAALPLELAELGVPSRVTWAGVVYLPDDSVPAKSGAPRPRYLVTGSLILRPAP